MMEQTLARDMDETKDEIARLLVQADAQRNAIESLRTERDRLQAEAVQTAEYLQAVNARLVECQAECGRLRAALGF